MVIITKLQVAPVELDVSSQSSSTCRASRASRARRVERVELCCSTSSTQPKCMGSTRRMCRVESSQVEFELYPAFLRNSRLCNFLLARVRASLVGYHWCKLIPVLTITTIAKKTDNITLNEIILSNSM